MTARLSYHTRVTIPMLCLVATAVRADDLRDLLPIVAMQARAPRPLRADVRLERTGVPAVQAVLLERGRRRYLETRTGTRALLSPGKVVIVRDGRVVRAAPGAALEGSDILLEDLEPFGTGSLTIPQVSDEGPTGMVVTGSPAPPTAYVLLVHTMDPEKAVIVKTKYYRDSVTNLVKMSRDDDFIEVGGRWRPGTFSMEAFRPDTRTTTLTLAWREAQDAPAAVFTPAGCAPSPMPGSRPLDAQIDPQLGRHALQGAPEPDDVVLRRHDQPHAHRVHRRPRLRLRTQLAVQIGDVGALLLDDTRDAGDDARLVDAGDDAFERGAGRRRGRRRGRRIKRPEEHRQPLLPLEALAAR
jgi:hypothetical protein